MELEEPEAQAVLVLLERTALLERRVHRAVPRVQPVQREELGELEERAAQEQLAAPDRLVVLGSRVNAEGQT